MNNQNYELRSRKMSSKVLLLPERHESKNENESDNQSESESEESNIRVTSDFTETYKDCEESMLAISLQMFIPYLLAGFGMVAASIVLDVVQHWSVFRKVPELYILVPALLGLKGNLEMTLASRLSTQANMGYLNSFSESVKLISANLALIQCQAIVIGFLASIAAVVMGWVPEGKFNINHALLLASSSVLTAALASFVLGVIMVIVILLSDRYHINPDNVATPIAASLGDLTTLALLSWISSRFYVIIASTVWIAPVILILSAFSVPLWGHIAARHPHTKSVLSEGWVPVISAMLISSMGGLILDFTISNYKGIAVYQLVINGVGGNLVGVQASRISTSLHKSCTLGQLPRNHRICFDPAAAFCSSGGHARTARVLLAMVIPGHLIFTYLISYVEAGHTSLTLIFMIVYLSAALLQVFLLLYICHIMIHWMWKLEIDPDNSAIPYLTAIGDLLGTALLGIAFQFLFLIGDRDSDLGD